MAPRDVRDERKIASIYPSSSRRVIYAERGGRASPAARAWARASYARLYKGEKAVRGERGGKGGERAYEQPANAVGPRQPDGRRGRLEDRLDEAFCPEYVNEEEVSSDMERTNGVGGVAGVRHDG